MLVRFHPFRLIVYPQLLLNLYIVVMKGDAEASLEGLHGMVEKKLKELVEGTIILSQFQDFRKNLIGLTDVTRDYFEKLVKQLEKGFENIEMHYAGGVQ